MRRGSSRRGYCVALVCAGLSAAIGFCVLFFAQIALDIVLAFTPIAIACVFWPQTRWFFQGWLSQAINYVVLYVVVVIISKMVIAASVTTITTFVGPSADVVAVAAAVDPGVAAVQFLIKQGNTSVVARLDLRGLDDDLAVLSGREQTLRVLERAMEEHGPNVTDWLPAFQQGARYV